MIRQFLDALGWASNALGRALLELAPYLGAAYVGAWLQRHSSQRRKVLPVGYRNPLITIDLAEALGTDVTDADGRKIGREPAEEFEGLWVVIRNPKLQPQHVLVPPDTQLGPDGTPSIEDAMGGMREVVSRLVYDWNLPDPTDPAEDAAPLPIYNKDNHRTRGPVVEDVAKIPGAVVLLIGERVRQAVNPR